MNPLQTILSSNKLEGENYIDWKRNLDIVLTVEKHKYVLTTPCPPVPAANARQAEKDAHEAWLRSDEVAKCYCLASMSNVLQQSHKEYDTTFDLLNNLHEMFGGHGRQARQQAVRKFMNCRQKAGTPVRDHMLTVMGHLNEMDILGSEIDLETKIDMIMETLSDSFDGFCLKYSMNKLNYTVTELMKELQTNEAMLNKNKKKSGEAHVTEQKASTSGSNRVVRKPKNAKQAGSKKPYQKAKSAKGKAVAKDDKSEHNCHHCGEAGHWRRNCPAYLKTVKGKGMILVTQGCYTTNKATPWILDCGASDHVVCNLNGFRKIKDLSDGEF